MPLLAAPGIFASSPDVGSIVALLLGRAVRRRRRRPSILLRLRLAWGLARALRKLLRWRLITRLIRASLSALVTSSLHVVA
jgi:hypothetical protein